MARGRAHRMRSLLWPTTLKAEPTVLTRTGRVLHWTATGLASLFLLLIPAIATNGDPVDQNIVGFVFAGAWATGLFLVGRALRYILSGE